MGTASSREKALRAKIEDLEAQLRVRAKEAARSAISEASVAAAKDILAARLASLPKRATSRRHSLELIEMPSALTLAQAGKHFRFVNREVQCGELLSALWELESHRLNAPELAVHSKRWEAVKRSLFAMACTGMPGIGKTRFAREAAYHLARKKAAGAAGRAAEPAFEAVLEAAGSVFPARGEAAASFARELVRASYGDRNLRVDCSELNGTSLTAAGVAASLLREHIKHRGGPAAVAAWAAVDPHLDALAVAQCIIADAAMEYKATGIDECPALLINIDEAHCLPPELLGDVLWQLVCAVVVHGLRIFVTVTGIHPDRIRDAFAKSQIQVRDIVLPLLSFEHMQEVAAAFLPEAFLPDLAGTTPAWDYVLWWLGGVPRYLQYTFEEAAMLGLDASLAKSVSRKALDGALRAVEGDTLVTKVAVRVWHNDEGIRAAAVNNALVFAVAQTPVSRDHVLLPSADPACVVTVLSAQKDSLLYWQRLEGSELGIIEMPPLVLHWLQHRRPAVETLYPLRFIVPFMSSRDNEALAVNALMYKLHVHALLGAESVRLSELGLPVQAADDRAVSIPSCFAVRRTDGNVTADNFGELVKRVREGMRCAMQPVAFVNGPTASFPDAFIILADLVIFIQEKQRALARAGAAAGEVVPRVRAEDVSAKYSKLGAAKSLPHVFLFITDEAAPADGYTLVGGKQYVISRERLPALMGTQTAYLRSSMLSASAIDHYGRSEHAAVGGAGAAP